MAFFYELMAGGPAGALSTDLQRFPYHVFFVFGMLAEVDEELI
jgi:hypothetical protein